MSTINNQLVETLTKGNKAFKSGYGRIAANVRAIEEAQLTKLDDVAEHIKLSLVGFVKDDVAPLDKAYMMASKRILGASFGIAWDEDNECAIFRLPTKEVNRKKDPFKQAVAKFISTGATDEQKKSVMRLMSTLMSEGNAE